MKGGKGWTHEGHSWWTSPYPVPCDRTASSTENAAPLPEAPTQVVMSPLGFEVDQHGHPIILPTQAALPAAPSGSAQQPVPAQWTWEQEDMELKLDEDGLLPNNAEHDV